MERIHVAMLRAYARNHPLSSSGSSATAYKDVVSRPDLEARSDHLPDGIVIARMKRGRLLSLAANCQ